MRILHWLSACAALLAVNLAGASPHPVELSVYDRTAGRTLPIHDAEDERFVAGTPGNEYSLRLHNRSTGDVLAVVSVDGVNVISGQTASPTQGGYVIPAGGYVEIKGWRKSLERIAAFYFTDLGDSYAARTGRPDDVGVIGVAVFERKQRPIAMREDEAVERAPRLAAPPSSKAAESASSLGTGHGRNEASAARMVTFERATDTPAQRIALRYDSRRNLMAMGVIPASPRRPHAFPGEFVPDPR